MQSHYITHNNSTVHYRQFGNGPEIVFCFHGYGRESYTFSVLERRLGNRFTIIAIDIPFHGLTQWKDELIFKPAYLTQFLLRISKSLHRENEKFSLLGFSMGGRICLHLAQLLAPQIKRLVLLAPDGLSFNFWRWFASETWLGNGLLKYIVYHPAWFASIINKAEKWNVIHRNLADFVRYYTDDKEHRLLLYRRWISTRKFSPDLRKLKQLILKYKIPVRMMFGRYDKVIPYSGGEKFRKGIQEYASVKVVETGHHLLGDIHAGAIAELFND